ncbi:MAG: diacylglycerol kinase [Xanthomonadales bacterium]|nr:diacylglycerol kinase [Xanthomonadales bacterium]
MKPGKTGIKRVIDATGYSLQGLAACWRNEAAFRQEVALFIVLFPAAFFVAHTVEQWLILVTPLFLLLIVELLNSAVETTVDRISSEMHELSGRAKDIGSAAVFVSLLMIAVCWGALIWKNFLA